MYSRKGSKSKAPASGSAEHQLGLALRFIVDAFFSNTFLFAPALCVINSNLASAELVLGAPRRWRFAQLPI